VTVTVDEQRASDARSIVRLMDGVLKKVEDTFISAGVSLPERRYWVLGTPVVDCEQLTVSFIQAYIGPPGDEASLPQRCDAPKTAVLQVQVQRCVPTAITRNGRTTPPKAEQMQSASEALAIDLFLLLDASAEFDVWDQFGGPGLGVIATVEATEAQGGFQGAVLNLTLAIP
jgi:hypothetical protein